MFRPCYFLLSASLAGSSVFASAAPGGGIDGSGTSAWINRPSSFSLEVHALKDGPATGANVVVPLLGRGKTRILGQGYGFKGDASLGGLGFGLILRNRLRTARMVEASAFIEGLQDREGFSYPQFGLGLAYSETWFTARINGYFPLRGGTDRPTDSARWTERERLMDGSVVGVDWSRESFEHVSPGLGFDAELEFHLPEPPRWVDRHLVLVYFYREADDLSAVLSGVLVRGELHFGENWALEGEWRDDASDIGQEYRFVVRYQKRFGGGEEVNGEQTIAGSSYMDRMMSGPVERRPWPTVTHPKHDGDARRGGARLLFAPEHASPTPLPDDCCPSAGSPLIFE
jgi:hypothetical protein